MGKSRIEQKNRLLLAAIVSTGSLGMLFNEAQASGNNPIPDLCPGSGVICKVEGVPGIPGGKEKGRNDGAIVIKF